MYIRKYIQHKYIFYISPIIFSKCLDEYFRHLLTILEFYLCIMCITYRYIFTYTYNGV